MRIMRQKMNGNSSQSTKASHKSVKLERSRCSKLRLPWGNRSSQFPGLPYEKGMRVETRLQQGLQLGIVAQLVAQMTFNHLVVGSSPTDPTKEMR